MALDNLVYLVAVLRILRYWNVSVLPISDVDQDSQIPLKFLVLPESWFFVNNIENLCAVQRHASSYLVLATFSNIITVNKIYFPSSLNTLGLFLSVVCIIIYLEVLLLFLWPVFPFKFHVQPTMGLFKFYPVSNTQWAL